MKTFCLSYVQPSRNYTFSFKKYAFNDIPMLILFVMNLKPRKGSFIKFARLCKHLFPPCSTSTS